MKGREKALAVAIASVVGVLVLGFLLKAVFQRPLKERDRKIATVREQLNKLKADRRAYFTHEKFVKDLAERTFSDQADQASAKSGEMITRVIVQSGLSEADFSRTPFGPRKLALGIETVEIGWSVQGEGKLPDVVNLLFLLQELPYLHRIENLVLTPGEVPGQVRVHFRFLTLVVKPAPPADYAELPPKYSLYSPERNLYAGIIERDLLRPYIKRPPPASPGGPRPRSPSTAPGLEAPGPESFRIVSLSEWMGSPEVHVRDQVNQTTLRLKAGDPLAGGTIALVDYRPMPMPGKEYLNSSSRVIVKIGTEYWAIERGQTLAQKYRLAPAQLPDSLGKALK